MNRVQARSRSFVVGISLLLAVPIIYILRADIAAFLADTASKDVETQSMLVFAWLALLACAFYGFRLAYLGVSPGKIEDQIQAVHEITTEGTVFSLAFVAVIALHLGGAYAAVLGTVGVVLAYRLWRRYLQAVTKASDVATQTPDGIEETSRIVEQRIIEKYRKWAAVAGFGSLTAIAAMIWSLYGYSKDAAVEAAKLAAKDSEAQMEQRFSQSAGIIGQLHSVTVESLTEQLKALGGVRRDLERVSSLLPVLNQIELDDALKNAEILAGNQEDLRRLVAVDDLDPRVSKIEGELTNFAMTKDLPDFSEYSVGDHTDVSRYALQTHADSIATEASNLVPIGTIVASALPPLDFDITANGNTKFDPVNAKWLPADGRDSGASRYGQKRSKVPDLRGLFVRGFDAFEDGNSAGIDPGPRDESGLQSDQIGGHSHHLFSVDVESSHPDTNLSEDSTVASANKYSAGSVRAYQFVPAEQNDIPTLGRTSASNAPETRPKNRALYFYIRVN